MKTPKIIFSLGALSKRWLGRDFIYRRRAVGRLVKHSGYSQAMAEALMDALFRELTSQKLRGLLRVELGGVSALDDGRARGPRTILHVFAGNVPNPAIVSFILGMLVKSRNIGKVSSRDGGFLDIYLSSLKAHDPALARLNTLLPSADRAAVQLWLKKADQVVVYGNDQTVAEIRKITPVRTPFFAHGHKTSVSFYTKEAFSGRNAAHLARKTAYDIWMLDQRGCLSPAAIYLEKGGPVSPKDFITRVASELGRLSAVKPGLDRAAVAAAVRDRWAIERLSGKNAEIWESPVSGQWLMLYDEKVKNLNLSSGGQIAYFKGVTQANEVIKALAPIARHLQAVSLEAPANARKRLARKFIKLGASRICRAGTMQTPSLLEPLDGQPYLAHWVTRTDLDHEPGTNLSEPLISQ